MADWGRVAGAVVATGLCASAASAQLSTCTLPDTLPMPKLAGPSPDEPRRAIPIASYTLALIWSPQQCKRVSDAKTFQCDASYNRFGFVLHGLWPDGAGRDWPQYCRAVPRLPAQLLRTNLCMTPSVDLLQHEWAKHGSCMTRSPERYFAQARALYGRLRFPDMTRLAQGDSLTVARFTQAFVAANRQQLPSLSARAVRVRLSRDGALDEVWLCLDRRQRFAVCRVNQDGGVTADRRMRIQPIR